MRRGRRLAGAVFAVLAAAAAAPAAAQQYVTDDPETVDPGHVEIIAFASRTKEAGEAGGTAGLEFAVGLAPNFELGAILPIDHAGDRWTRGRVGDIEIGITWLVAHQRAGSLVPDVAFAPSLLLPTGAMSIRPGRAGLFLPIWLRKDVGAWSWAGGGGYSLNAGAGRRNSWLAATRIARRLGPRLDVGAEVYRETADSDGGRTATGLAAAATYRLSARFSIEMSAGPLWVGGERGSRIYIGLAAAF